MALVLSDKDRGPRYSKAVGWFATTEMGSNEAILDAYPWDQFGLVVDVTKMTADLVSVCLSLLTYCRWEGVVVISVAAWQDDIPKYTVSFKTSPPKLRTSKLLMISQIKLSIRYMTSSRHNRCEPTATFLELYCMSSAMTR
jgi:hypothetical protein